MFLSVIFRRCESSPVAFIYAVHCSRSDFSKCYDLFDYCSICATCRRVAVDFE
jgi:hypothetical protein